MYTIYQILNKKTGWRYIGCSKKYENRWNEHRNDLNENKHHNIHLQRAWNKYGEDTFEFSIMLNVDSEKQMFLEEAKIIELEDNLYNIALGGSGGDTFSNNPNKEKIRKNMTIANKLKINVDKNPFKNLTPSEYLQRCKKWSEASKGPKNGRFKHSQQVKQIDKQTKKVVKIYEYARLVIDDGYNPKYVINCCNNKLNFHSHGGFLWEWDT